MSAGRATVVSPDASRPTGARADCYCDQCAANVSRSAKSCQECGAEFDRFYVIPHTSRYAARYGSVRPKDDHEVVNMKHWGLETLRASRRLI